MRRQKVLSPPLHRKDVHMGPFSVQPPFSGAGEAGSNAQAWHLHHGSMVGTYGPVRAAAERGAAAGPGLELQGKGGASTGPPSLQARTVVGTGCCGAGPSARSGSQRHAVLAASSPSPQRQQRDKQYHSRCPSPRGGCPGSVIQPGSVLPPDTLPMLLGWPRKSLQGLYPWRGGPVPVGAAGGWASACTTTRQRERGRVSMEVISIPKFLDEAEQLLVFQHISPGQRPQHVPIPNPRPHSGRRPSSLPLPALPWDNILLLPCARNDMVPHGRTRANLSPKPLCQLCPKTPAWILQTWHVCELAPPDRCDPAGGSQRAELVARPVPPSLKLSLSVPLPQGTTFKGKFRERVWSPAAV